MYVSIKQGGCDGMGCDVGFFVGWEDWGVGAGEGGFGLMGFEG